MNTMTNTETIDGLASPAATSSYLYGLLGECIAYPDAELVENLQSGALLAQIQSLCDALDPTLLDGLNAAVFHDPDLCLDTLEVEYTRLFDAGARGTGCSLNGGLQRGPQMKVMEEAVRFYAHFGLTLTEEQKELPDHLTTQLNFLHFLAYGEHLLQVQGESTDAYRLARRDFIARHPGRWLPIMEDKLRTMEPMPLFLSLTELLQRLLSQDLAQLEAQHGTASLKPSGDLPFGGL